MDQQNMWMELLKNSPTLAAVIIVVFGFIRSQRDITNDFKEVVREIHEDMKTIHADVSKSRDAALVRLEQAAQAAVQNSISNNNLNSEIQKLSVEVRRLADQWRQG